MKAGRCAIPAGAGATEGGGIWSACARFGARCGRDVRARQQVGGSDATTTVDAEEWGRGSVVVQGQRQQEGKGEVTNARQAYGRAGGRGRRGEVDSAHKEWPTPLTGSNSGLNSKQLLQRRQCPDPSLVQPVLGLKSFHSCVWDPLCLIVCVL